MEEEIDQRFILVTEKCAKFQVKKGENNAYIAKFLHSKIFKPTHHLTGITLRYFSNTICKT